jgi:hypothetical protein
VSIYRRETYTIHNSACRPTVEIEYQVDNLLQDKIGQISSPTSSTRWVTVLDWFNPSSAGAITRLDASWYRICVMFRAGWDSDIGVAINVIFKQSKLKAKYQNTAVGGGLHSLALLLVIRAATSEGQLSILPNLSTCSNP